MKKQKTKKLNLRKLTVGNFNHLNIEEALKVKAGVGSEYSPTVDPPLCG